MPDSPLTSKDSAIRLSKIETKAPTISITDMNDPVQLALGIIRIKDLAKQLNIWDFFNNGSVAVNADDATVYKRWLCNAFECQDTRAVISRKTTPAECWSVIQTDVLIGNSMEEVVYSELSNLSWNSSGGNIVSFNSKFYILIDELQDLKGERVPLARLKKIYGRAMPERYQSIVQVYDSAPDDLDIHEYVRLITAGINRNALRNLDKERKSDGYGAMYSQMQRHLDYDGDDNSHGYYSNPIAFVTRASVESVREHGYYQTREVADGIAASIRDYLELLDMNDGTQCAEAFESRLDSARRNGNASQSRRSGSFERRRPNPPARELARRPDRDGRSKQCRNCGKDGHSYNTCQSPKVKCTHAICKERGIDDHCDEMCIMYHRELCPPKFVEKRDAIVKSHDEKNKTKREVGDFADEHEWPEESYWKFNQTASVRYMDAVSVEGQMPASKVLTYADTAPKPLPSPSELLAEAFSKLPFYLPPCGPISPVAENSTAEPTMHCVEALAPESLSTILSHIHRTVAACKFNTSAPIDLYINAFMQSLLHYLAFSSASETHYPEAQMIVSQGDTLDLHLLHQTVMCLFKHAFNSRLTLAETIQCAAKYHCYHRNRRDYYSVNSVSRTNGSDLVSWHGPKDVS